MIISGRNTFWEKSCIIQRQEQLASLFDGYHYVLSILAEIHSGFIPILRTHTRLILDRNYLPWTTPTYRTNDEALPDEKILYLIGSSHTRMMSLEEYYVYNRYKHSFKRCKEFEINKAKCFFIQAKTILSNRMQSILKKTNILAIESYEKDDPPFKESPLEEDKFEQRKLANKCVESELGLEASAINYMTYERHCTFSIYRCQQKKTIRDVKIPFAKFSQLALMQQIKTDHKTQLVEPELNTTFSEIDYKKVVLAPLESRKDHLKSMDETDGDNVIPEIIDFDEVIQMYDIIYSSDAESSEQFLTPQPNSPYEKHLEWRNRVMVNSIKSLVIDSKEGSVITVIVGAAHLYGQQGILKMLAQSNIFVTCLEDENIPLPKEEDIRIRRDAVTTFTPEPYRLCSMS